MNSLSLNLIKKSDRHYRRWFNKTPIEYSKVLSDHLQTPTILKLENMHVSGSYKLRCAHFAFSFLTEKEKKAGIALASSGYFGLAFAYVCYMHNVECHIYTPKGLTDSFKEKILGYEAFIHTTTNTTIKSTFDFAEKVAQEKNLTFIDTHESLSYMATGGAIVKEVMEDVPQLCTLVMPYSGFGLLEGAKYYLSSIDSGFKLIAVNQTSTSTSNESIQNMPRYDELKTVSGTEVKNAMKWLLNHHQILIDSSGAIPLAALLKKAPPKLDGPVTVVLSGRYIDKKTLKALI